MTHLLTNSSGVTPDAYSLRSINFFLPKYIIDTHTHADHFSLAAVLKKEFKAPIMMSVRIKIRVTRTMIVKLTS
jgi:hypothetical protein